MNNIDNAKRYPLGNTFLDDETDYVKNSYFTMLAIFLQQGGNDSTAQKTLFTRLVAGAETERTMEDYFRGALNFSTKMFEEFVEQCKGKDLRYRFILDALVLLGCDEHKNETMELLVTFVEALKITKEDMLRLFKLTKSILECDSDLYWEYDNDKVYALTQDNLQDYIGSYLKDYVKIDDQNFIMCLAKRRYILLSDYVVEESKTGAFLGEHRRKVEKKNKKYYTAGFHLFSNVTIKNCILDNKSEHFLKFFGCRAIVFEYCIFQDLRTGINLDADDYWSERYKWDRLYVTEDGGERFLADFYKCNFSNFCCVRSYDMGMYSLLRSCGYNKHKRINCFLHCNFENASISWIGYTTTAPDLSSVSCATIFTGVDVKFLGCNFVSCCRRAPEGFGDGRGYTYDFVSSESYSELGFLSQASYIEVDDCSFRDCMDYVNDVVWGPNAKNWNKGGFSFFLSMTGKGEKKSFPSRLFNKGTVDNGTNKMENCAQFS